MVTSLMQMIGTTHSIVLVSFSGDNNAYINDLYMNSVQPFAARVPYMVN